MVSCTLSGIVRSSMSVFGVSGGNLTVTVCVSAVHNSASWLRFLRLLLSPRVFGLSLSFLLCMYAGNNSPAFTTKCRACRRQLRERSQTAGHHEGMSSDDELTVTELAEFQKSRGWSVDENKIPPMFRRIFKGEWRNTPFEWYTLYFHRITEL